MLRILAAAALIATACSKKKDERIGGDSPVTAPPAAAEGSGDEATAPADEPGTRGALTPLDEKPPEEVYDTPTERRLYSDRVESSTFLWTDWNRFQENYHPNYAVDGDPATAWVEGADDSGEGEWLRVHLSPVSGATRVRLRIQPGYHKSRSLFEKNARLKKLEVKALPGGDSKTFSIEDAMEWQEVALDLKGGPIEAIELSVEEVYEGSKYRDLCISDLEIFVTGLTKDSPAFEKKKLDRLLAWKKERLEAAKIFADSDRAGTLPIAPGYRVDSDRPRLEVPKVEDGAGDWLRRAVALAAGQQKQHAELLELASSAIRRDYDDWVAVDVVSKRAIDLPEVDGLREPDGFELVMGSPSDAFFLPHTGEFALIDSSRLSVFDSAKAPPQEHRCRAGKSTFKRPPAEQLSGPTPRALLHQWCVEEETREGTMTYLSEMLLLYDEKGQLLFLIGPSDVHYYQWKQGEGGAQILGGERYDPGGRVDALLVMSEVARP